MKEQLQDKTQRAVLRSLGSLHSGEAKSFDGLGANVKEWKDAAHALVEQGLALEVKGTFQTCYSITRSGRYLLRQEENGAKQ